MITKLAIAGYRSLRDIRLSLGPLNVVTGANGSGKSSLYRAVRLLADIAQGRIIQSLAAEGGLHSTLWAGPESFSRAMKKGEQPVQGLVRKGSVSLKLGFAGTDYGYAIDLGLGTASPFLLDPEIKTESQWTGEALTRSNVFAARNGPSVRIRDDTGEWRQVLTQLAPFDSMMTHCSDPRRGARVADAARAHARLALLRSFPHRSRCAGTPAADRDLHACARRRRRRPSRRAWKPFGPSAIRAS